MSELYELPYGWEWKNIGETCENLDRLRKPISKKNRVFGKYPYYGASKIVDYVDNYIFDEQLVLIGEDGAKWDIGDETAFIATGKYWVNNHAHVIRPNRELLDDSWLVYYLFVTDLSDYITGTTVPKLNQTKLKEILFPLPPLQEQKRIVLKLDTIFEKIDKSIALHVENIKDADAFMGSVLNDIFIELEEKYEKQAWNEVLKIRNGKHYKDVIDDNGQYPIYGSGGIMNYANDYLCNENTVIIGRKGTINNPLFVKEKFWNIDTAFGIEANKNVLLPMFLFYFSKNFNFLDLNKSTTLPSLAKTHLLKIMMILPPLNIQQKTVTYLDKISKKVETLKSVQKEKMESLVALKASILDKAFRGEL